MLGLGLNFWCAARAAGGTPQSATLTLTADDPAFTAGSGGNPAQIDFTIVYDGADTLTGYLVTSDSASPPSAAEVIAGSGTGIIEGISWSETEGSLDLTGLTALSNGDKYLYLVIKEDAGDAVSDVLSITATGLDFTNPQHSSAETDTGGTTVTATMTESMVGTEATGDWVVKVGGSAITVSAVSISGTDIALTVSPAIENGDTVTYSYSGGDLEDAQGNPLGTITDQGVTNNVPAAGPFTDLGQYTFLANSGSTGQYSSPTPAFGADGTVYALVAFNGPAASKVDALTMTIGGNAASIPTDGVTSAEADSVDISRVAIFSADVLSTDNGFALSATNAGSPRDAANAVSVWLIRPNSGYTINDVTSLNSNVFAAPWSGNLDANALEGGAVMAVAITLEETVTFDTITGLTQLGTRHNSLSSNGGSMIAGISETVAATPRTIRIGDTSVSPGRFAGVAITLGTV